MTKPLFITALLAASAIAFGAVAANGPASFYDRPVKVVHLPLPKDPLNPTAKAELSCAYFPLFMVKQIDLGEEGADQLSILPVSAACQHANVANEKVISAKDWSGYFDGVKDRYIFFRAADGWNSGMGFALFNADGKKIYDDTATKWSAIDVTRTGVLLKYARVYEAKCPLRTGADACWQKLKSDTGVTDAKWPDCESAYAKAIKGAPKDASILTDPSVISYDVTVAVDGGAHKMAPATGHGIRFAEPHHA